MNFNRVAALYETLERITFGRALERGRTALLDEIPRPGRALLVGDGDGRFLKELLDRFPDVAVDFVEPSAAMIRVAQRRIGSRGNVRFQASGIFGAELTRPYDLVVSHFVLDVFTPEEVGKLTQIVRRAAPQGRWLISEFRVTGLASQVCVTGMYAFFWLAAGVKVREIPAYAQILEKEGMSLTLQHRALNGFVSSELWRIPAPTC